MQVTHTKKIYSKLCTFIFGHCYNSAKWFFCWFLCRFFFVISVFDLLTLDFDLHCRYSPWGLGIMYLQFSGFFLFHFFCLPSILPLGFDLHCRYSPWELGFCSLLINNEDFDNIFWIFIPFLPLALDFTFRFWSSL